MNTHFVSEVSLVNGLARTQDVADRKNKEQGESVERRGKERKKMRRSERKKRKEKKNHRVKDKNKDERAVEVAE